MTAYNRLKVNLIDSHKSKIASLIILAMIIVYPGSAMAMELLLGTGEAGTFSHFVGRSICRAINRHTADSHCRAIPADNDLHNVTNLQGGSLDICLIDSRTLYNAVNRKGNFEYLDIRFDNILSLQRVYDNPVTLVVRKDAGIAALDELKGKRFNAGTPGSSQHRMVDAIMNAKNWTRKDFSLLDELPESQSQADMAFCHGTIQALVHIGVHPDPPVQQLVKLCNAGLVGIDDSDIQGLISRHPAFTKVSIKGGIYTDQPDAIATLATSMLLVSSQVLDEDTVYTIMEALYSRQKQLKSAHPALADFNDKGAGDPHLGLARHPGAVKYFSEK